MPAFLDVTEVSRVGESVASHCTQNLAQSSMVSEDVTSVQLVRCLLSAQRSLKPASRLGALRLDEESLSRDMGRHGCTVRKFFVEVARIAGVVGRHYKRKESSSGDDKRRICKKESIHIRQE